MRISRQNQKLLFGVALIAAVGLALGHMLEKGADAVGEKQRVLELAGPLAQCTNREQYLALLEQRYPPGALLWRSPMMSASDEGTTLPASLERLPDGRLKVVVWAMSFQQMLDPRGYGYLPAALVDDKGRGYRLRDLRLNSRKADMVFEYYYGALAEGEGGRARSFYFFMGRRQWQLQPGAIPLK